MARMSAPSAVPDVLGSDLRCIFCGINPGRVSAAAAAHFANPRNDFWRLVHAAAFTPRLYAPEEQFELLELGYGLTNAAYRTTAGSGDLRRGDFSGSADRLEQIALELSPRWIAFVGKEAYRGVFGARPELGIQERALGATRLFVLPSTSPANAAVPWDERLRWFQELAGRSSGLPLRDGVRALVVDSAGSTLLLRFVMPDRRSFWASPGGGVESGESDAHALERELAEECGLRHVEIGPLVWTREHWFADIPGWAGQRERHYLIRTERFEPAPELDLAAEGVQDMGWFSAAELDEIATAPRRLAVLLRDLLDRGPSAEPPGVGV
jgi:TDG/mug DNA glycosylase family protein